MSQRALWTRAIADALYEPCSSVSWLLHLFGKALHAVCVSDLGEHCVSPFEAHIGHTQVLD